MAISRVLIRVNGRRPAVSGAQIVQMLSGRRRRAVEATGVRTDEDRPADPLADGEIDRPGCAFTEGQTGCTTDARSGANLESTVEQGGGERNRTAVEGFAVSFEGRPWTYMDVFSQVGELCGRSINGCAFLELCHRCAIGTNMHSEIAADLATRIPMHAAA